MMEGFIPKSKREQLDKGIQDLCVRSEGTIEFRTRLATIATSLIPCSAPCSVVLADNFFSRGGRFAAASHVNHESISLGTVRSWEAVLRRGNPIERELAKRANREDTGVARFGSDIEPELSGLTKIAKKLFDQINALKTSLKVEDMMYGWIFSEYEGTEGDSYTQLLIICLRRVKSDGPFTVEEARLLSELVNSLKNWESYWFNRPVASLTPVQQEVMELIRLGLSSKEVAFTLGKDEGTVNNTILRICDRLDAKNRIHAAVKYEALRKPKSDPNNYLA